MCETRICNRLGAEMNIKIIIKYIIISILLIFVLINITLQLVFEFYESDKIDKFISELKVELSKDDSKLNAKTTDYVKNKLSYKYEYPSAFVLHYILFQDKNLGMLLSKELKFNNIKNLKRLFLLTVAVKEQKI